ncbi:hypothetical protein LSM04_008844 [Trypanosoma melophagium]|uniref:uncharacterized protein n=1 Tax=Trypanosoma melophagium TaxID=715481 RepID=UPI00351A68C6|nr:hypothetical protein LSM04_008844 [Trypanosoma melophagium]
MHVTFPPPPRLSPRGSSAAHARRLYLRFAPLARPAAGEVGEDASAVSLSLTSVSQSFMSSPAAGPARGKREELILMRPSPPMASGKAQQRQQKERQRKSACSSSFSSSRSRSSNSNISDSSRRDGSHSQGGQGSQKMETPSPRNSFLFSDISSSFDDEYRRRSATRCTVRPLSEEEAALVNAAYKKYFQSTDKPGCLLVLLQELGASDNPADYEVWLQQLENFLCISRDQLLGSSMTTTERTEESDKNLGKQQRVLTEEDVSYFATWLKTTRGELFGPRSTLRSDSILVDGSKCTTPSSSSLAGTNTTTTRAATTTVAAVAEEEKDSNRQCNNDRSDENGSAKRRKGSHINWRDARKALAPVFTQEREKSSPRSTGPASSVALHSPNPLPPPHTPTPSARGLLLERRAFAELGGGQDGSGGVRIVDLKRMLRSFHVETNFDACVGRTIDLDRRGWINFEEFLWVLEYGVRGEGPAADIHAYLSAPLNDSAVSSQSPQRPRSRTPHSHQRGKSNPQNTTNTNTSHNNVLSTVLSGRRRRQSRRSNRNVRLPGVRCNSARRREKAAGRPVSERRNLSVVEDIHREFLTRIVKMSPYSAGAEPVRRRRQQKQKQQQQQQQNGRLQPHPPHRRSHVRPSHSRTRRQASSRAKSAGARRCGGGSFDKIASSSHCDAAARKLQLLREQQTSLTKRLKSLTALPSCDQEARERTEELQSVQDELNTVLDHIAATMRELTVAGERVDGE